MLVRLMYASRAAASVDQEELVAILRKSKADNPLVGITGVLCVCTTSGIFLQVLERGRTAVNKLYNSIVADPRLHPLEGMNTYDKALQWLQVHQPRLHAELEPLRHTLQDFAYFKRFSYGCKQVYSAARWALTGEAGLFLDPFYSPGSDFIAISNTFVADLIARDLAGAPLAGHAAMYDQIFHSFYDNTMALYLDQYALFGNAEVLPVKVLWDYSYYWGVLCPLFIPAWLSLRRFNRKDL